MGALHEGHARLIDRARRLAGRQGSVAVSIFVNPTQFGPNEDFTRYPRTMREDRQLCAERGADVIFAPQAAEMYPDGFSTYVDETSVSLPLCGGARPGHFRGVCTVVLKLFHLLAPDTAIFGQKDYQQCAVIRRMVRDLNVPVRIVAEPTVRESDGLAMSSRNRYLSAEERAQAPAIYAALRQALEAYVAGEIRAATLTSIITKHLRRAAPLARLDYAEIRDAASLEPVRKITTESVAAVAAFFGKTRLIDNILLPAPKS